jgi:putative IMPACT (imprinted ancient) family translation regulator
MPIYGQIQSFGLTNVLLAVIRIYGGTKLGVGGLIQAYRATAKMALDSAEIITKTLQQEYELNFDYPKLNSVLRILKHPGITMVRQEMQQRCTFHIAVRHEKAEKMEALMRNIPGVSITKYSR